MRKRQIEDAASGVAGLLKPYRPSYADSKGVFRSARERLGLVPERPRRRDELPSDADVERFVRAVEARPNGTRDALFFRLVITTGWKPGSVARLRVDSFSEGFEVVGSISVTARLPAAIACAVAARARGRMGMPWLFPSPNRSGHLSLSHFRRVAMLAQRDLMLPIAISARVLAKRSQETTR